ncbi:MAG: helix-turn-helix domain-containing protein [Gemmataceae bacterium]
MREFTFSDEVLAEVRHDRVRHPHPRVQQEMNVLWLKAKGLTDDTIADLADTSLRTVQRVLSEFLGGGLDAVRATRWEGKHAELDDHAPALEDHFVARPPRTAREAQAEVERLTGVRRGLTQVRASLKKRSTCGGGRSAPCRPRETTTSRPGP